MTFSQIVKQELLQTKRCCKQGMFAFIYGMLSFVGIKKLEDFFTDNKETAWLVGQMLQQDFKTKILLMEQSKITSGHKRFGLCLSNQQNYRYQQRYDIAAEQALTLIKQQPCCIGSFLRGVFVGCGTIVNPKKEYHFEFKLHTMKQALQIQYLLQQEGQAVHVTKRKGMPILYLKESQQIEEMLTYLGAVSSVFALMNIKIEKELRNHANRIRNCETANIEKTVNASLEQVEDIQWIIQTKGWNFLSQPLCEAAKLRLDYPEFSLQELCAKSIHPISRSGLYHRFKKLSDIAAKLQKDQKKSLSELT